MKSKVTENKEAAKPVCDHSKEKLELYIFLTQRVIVKYAVYKYVSLASKFELPHISIPYITGSANSVYENTCIKTARKTIVLQNNEMKWSTDIISTVRGTVMFCFSYFMKLSYPAWNILFSSHFQRSLISSSENTLLFVPLWDDIIITMWYLRVKIHAAYM